MTSIEAMKYIDKTYIKYIDSINDMSSYIDDVIHILNKVTNSKIYECQPVSGLWRILKNHSVVWEWLSNDFISLAQLLKNEILLHKLELLEE